MSEIVKEDGKKISIRKNPQEWRKEAENRGMKKQTTKIYRIEIDEKNWIINGLSIISVSSEDGKIVVYVEGDQQPTQAELNLLIERLNNKYRVKDIKEVV